MSEYAVGIDADLCEVDVDVFRHDSVVPGASAVTLDTLARAAYAAGLYKGDLLEDWDLEWCCLEREQLRQRFVHTLRTLAEGFERMRRYDLALQYARRVADADPSHEPAQRAIIRLLMRTGDRASAASQFRRFEAYARSELGVEPDSQTIALFGQIKERSPEHSTGVSAEARAPILPGMVPLVGRSEERQQITALIDSAMAGTGGSVLMLGEAGVGKSRLAEWTMEEWAARGGLTARGRCIEFNDPIPYQPVLDAIGSVSDITGITGFATRDSERLPSIFADEVTGGAAGSGRSDSPWPAGKFRLFGWLLTRLHKVSRRRPLLIVVEDLQWIDPSSVDFLAYLLERARTMRVLVLVTARPSGSKTGNVVELERLSRHCSANFRLGSLTPVETADLVKVLLDNPRPSPSLVRSIYSETEGNPLFVVETIRLLYQQGRMSGSEIAISVPGDPGRLASGQRIPDGVRSAVEQRLQLIDSSVLRVARIASVLGRSFDEELLAMVASTGANRLSRAIGRLLRAGIFEREDGGYRFTHDKIRAVCYENLPARMRRIYHARAAAALSQLPDLPVHRLAWHQHSAGQWGLATASWELAGDHARTIHAHEEALRAYQFSIECARRDEETDAETANQREIRLLLKCDKTLTVLGRPADRRKILERIDFLCGAASKGALRAEWFVRRALLEDYTGNCTLAATLARKAWNIARLEGDQQVEVEALHVLAYQLARVDRFRRSLAVLRLALRRIGDAKSPSMISALINIAAVHLVLGDYASASANIEGASRIATDLGLRAEYLKPSLWRGLLDKWSGNVRASRLRFSESLRLANEANDAVTAARLTFQLASLDALEGRFGDALRRLREAIAACRTLGYARTQASALNEVAYSVGRLLGNYTWAWNASAHGLRLPVTVESKYLSWMIRDSQVMLLLDMGRVDEAMTEITEVLRLIDPGTTSLALMAPLMESLARRGTIWLQLGNPNRALVDLEEARRAQVEMGHRLLLVDTLTHLALAHATLGDAERALLISTDALSLLAEIGHANHQPQRIFWHHYLVLEKFNREPRLQYLKRAVEFIEAQAATVSKAQARRFRRDVRLNREILEAWERHKQNLQPTVDERAVTPTAHEPASVAPASALPTM
ncbi:MAG: ATP-binding protein [Armatimonadota bacterium]